MIRVFKNCKNQILSVLTVGVTKAHDIHEKLKFFSLAKESRDRNLKHTFYKTYYSLNVVGVTMIPVLKIIKIKFGRYSRWE